MQNGAVLWGQFESTVAACLAGANSRQLAEKVNELAVAKILLDDPHLTGPVQYEPDMLPSGRKIDFVAARHDDNVYVEVKSINPKSNESEEAWKRFLKLSEHHPANVNFITNAGPCGGDIYSRLLSSRSKFLTNAIEFEERLKEAKEVRQGPGVLVYCCNGIAWDRCDLEDFADFYHHGAHRQDDLFSIMETHHIAENNITLQRNVDHFGFLKRPAESPPHTEFKSEVRGPRVFGPVG